MMHDEPGTTAQHLVWEYTEILHANQQDVPAKVFIAEVGGEFVVLAKRPAVRVAVH